MNNIRNANEDIRSLKSLILLTQGAKGAQSNLFKYTAASDKFTEVLDSAQERMQDFRDDDGNLLTVAPDTIIIPNSGALKRKIIRFFRLLCSASRLLLGP